MQFVLSSFSANFTTSGVLSSSPRFLSAPVHAKISAIGLMMFFSARVSAIELTVWEGRIKISVFCWSKRYGVNNGANCGYSGFIYYMDTAPFTDRNQFQIWHLCKYYAEEFGVSTYK
jgi:hypothetical protein